MNWIIFISSSLLLLLSSIEPVSASHHQFHKLLRGAPFISQFSFVCENGKCPKGPYQVYCPWASVGAASGSSGGYLQAYCFNENYELQTATILRNLRACTTPIIAVNGQLKCSRKASTTYPPTTPLGRGSRVYFRFQCRNSTQGYAPSSPSKNCPEGPYRQSCPLCALRVDGTLVCNCFNNKRELQKISFLPAAKRCNIIYGSNKGKLVCQKKFVEHGYE